MNFDPYMGEKVRATAHERPRDCVGAAAIPPFAGEGRADTTTAAMVQKSTAGIGQHRHKEGLEIGESTLPCCSAGTGFLSVVTMVGWMGRMMPTITTE